MGLRVCVENADDDPEGLDSLLNVLLDSVELVPQPSMSLEVLGELMARNHYAGHQVGMQRGTHQKTGEHGLDSFKAEAGTLSQFLGKLDNSITAGGWKLHNQFGNINRGGAEQPADGMSVASEEVSGFIGGKWHFDNFTAPATHRQANYYGNTGSLRIRTAPEGAVVTIIAPMGFGLRFACALLTQYEHAHGLLGRCISFVSEISGGSSASLGSSSSRQRVDSRQPPLGAALQAALTPFQPEKRFLGPNRSHGRHGVGSVRRMAVTQLAGGKVVGQRRNMKAARLATAKLSSLELKRLAAERGTTMSSLGRDADGQVRDLGKTVDGKAVAAVKRSRLGRDEDGQVRDLGKTVDGKAVAAVKRGRLGRDADGQVRDLGKTVDGKAVAAVKRGLAMKRPKNAEALSIEERLAIKEAFTADEKDYAAMKRLIGRPSGWTSEYLRKFQGGRRRAGSAK